MNRITICLLTIGAGTAYAFAAGVVTGRIDGQAVRVLVDGREFTAYRFDTQQKYPYFWPVNGPASGASLTTESSEPYPHHHSLFFGCDRVNGFNFWQEGNERGQIVSTGPKLVTAGPERVEIADRCLWQAPGRPPLAEDTRQITITAPSKDLRFIDFRITLRAMTDLRVEKTNHSLFAVRVMPHLSPQGGGVLADAEGRNGEAATFGRKGPWCDISGRNGEHLEGIAILDHPENPWFPSPWFTRDYGFASPTPMNWLGEEGWRLAKDRTISLRYRVVVHAGDAAQANVAALYGRWAGVDAIDVLPIALGFAGTPVNAGQSLVSDGRHQYAAFYDADRRLTVASRMLGAHKWTFAKLDEQVGWDSHNRIAIAVDRQGFVHLCANMHCDDLKYSRTSRPADINSFERIDRFGPTPEKRVTYPRFMRLPQTSELAVTFRIGGSGEGDTYLLRYDEASRSWSSIVAGPLLQGLPRFCAYPLGMQADAKGRLHLSWCWRETPMVETNQDVCYAVSADGGRTWQKSDGRPQPTPITPENAEVIDPVPQGGGLMNGGRLAIDDDNRPWIGYIKYGPNGGTQMYLATRDASGWRVIQLSNWAFRWELQGGGSVPSAGISIPQVSFRGGGGADVVFTHLQYFFGEQVIHTTVDELKRMKPGGFRCVPHITPLRRTGLDYSFAVANDGPLPDGERCWMIQKTAGNNRDREPNDKMAPTWLRLVSAKEGEGAGGHE